jgi:hypothetical protein
MHTQVKNVLFSTHAQLIGNFCAARTQRSRRARSQEAKAAVSLSFIMGGFLVCWLPFFVWMPLVHLLVKTT